MGCSCSKLWHRLRSSTTRQLNFTELETCGSGGGQELGSAFNDINSHSHVSSTKYSWDLKKTQACILDGLDSVDRIVETKGQQVIIKNCKNSRIYILDWTTSATVDDCSDCVIIVAAVGGSLFLRDTTSSTLVSASSQLRLRDCSLIHLFSACESDPIIEACNKIQVAPYFLYYDSIKDHFKSAKLDNFMATKWRNIYDYTPSGGSGGNGDSSEASLTQHWSVMKEPVDPNKYIPKLDKARLAIGHGLEAYKGFHLGPNSFVPITQDLDQNSTSWRERIYYGLVVLFPDTETCRVEALEFAQSCAASHPGSILLTVSKEGEAVDKKQRVVAFLLSITPQEMPAKFLGSVRYTQDRRSIEYFFNSHSS